MTCDGRLFHRRRAAATRNALSPTVDRRLRRTFRDVDEAERIAYSRRLASVPAGRRHTGTCMLAPHHVDIVEEF